MAQVYRVLAQSAPSATTLTDIYTATNVIAKLSAFMVANRAASATTFRASIAVNGASDTNKQYIYYDIAIPANESFYATLDIPLSYGDVFRVYAGSGNLSFSLFGYEEVS